MYVDKFDRDRVIERVLKLKAQAQDSSGATEAEAQAFAAKVQEMVVRHKIHEDELKVRGKAVAVEPIVEEWFVGKVVNCPSRPEGSWHANRIEWVEELARTVAEAHYCKLLARVGNGKLMKMYAEMGNHEKEKSWCASVGFVGRQSDAASALSTFEVMLVMVQKLGCRAYFDAYGLYVKGKAQWQRGFYRSWMLGFSARLRERYEEELGRMSTEFSQIAQSEARLLEDGQVQAEQPQQCAALVRIAKEAFDAVEDYFELKRAEGRLGYARAVGVGAGNVDAYGKGRAAADKVKLKADERIRGGSRGLLG